LGAVAPPPSVAAEQKTVIYANVGGDRVQRAFARLREAVERALPQAVGVRLQHFVLRDEYDAALLSEDIRRIVAMQPSAIVTPNLTITLAAQKATTTIPVIFGIWEDPVRAGLAGTFARPGRNLTGFTSYQPLEEKRLELLAECFPAVKRVAVLADRVWIAEPHIAPALAAVRRRFGLQVEAVVVENEAELKEFLASPRAAAIDAWYVPWSALPSDHPDLVLEALQRLGKPVIYTRTLFVEKGGLIAYQSEFEDVFAVWATLIVRVLQGIPPAIIPVERPRKFELALNLVAARRLGVDLPRSILKRADRFF
jgi:putative ABC transport system substrate-binding protein